MAKPSDIQNPLLQEKLQLAFDAMRASKGLASVEATADAFLTFIDLNPEVKDETIGMRGRQVPRLMRWPALGANLKPGSMQAGKPEIEFIRERFSVSEAMTYYQFVLEEILRKEGEDAA